MRARCEDRIRGSRVFPHSPFRLAPTAYALVNTASCTHRQAGEHGADEASGGAQGPSPAQAWPKLCSTALPMQQAVEFLQLAVRICEIRRCMPLGSEAAPPAGWRRSGQPPRLARLQGGAGQQARLLRAVKLCSGATLPHVRPAQPAACVQRHRAWARHRCIAAGSCTPHAA